MEIAGTYLSGSRLLLVGVAQGVFALVFEVPATSGVRATVHSLLAQAEYAGGILCRAGVALVASRAGLPVTLLTCALLFTITVVLIQRSSRTPIRRTPI